jgi:hypothetical protein
LRLAVVMHVDPGAHACRAKSGPLGLPQKLVSPASQELRLIQPTRKRLASIEDRGVPIRAG